MIAHEKGFKFHAQPQTEKLAHILVYKLGWKVVFYQVCCYSKLIKWVDTAIQLQK